MANAVDRFFSEFKDNPKSTKMLIMVILFLFLIIGATFSNYRQEADVVFACQMYLFLLGMVFVIVFTDSISEMNKFTASILAGTHKYFGFVPLIVGAGLGYLMVSQGQSIGVKMMQFTSFQAFQFIVIVAPIVEEFFFRWTMFPTIRHLLMGSGVKQASIIALFVANIAFGIFHFYVYGGSLTAVYGAAMIGGIYTIGNYYFKSGMFSIGAHMTNNYLLFSMV